MFAEIANADIPFVSRLVSLVDASLAPIHGLKHGLETGDFTPVGPLTHMFPTEEELQTSGIGSLLATAPMGMVRNVVIKGAVSFADDAARGTTYLYQKVGAAGEHLKFGITGNAATRYSAAELNGGRLRIIARGERPEMLRLERQLHETLPIGPEERQLFYIQKQIEKGLRPPPY